MAVRHRLIKCSPHHVWSVLADGTRYAEWVVGTSVSRPEHGQWPEVGSAIHYEIRIGPLTLENRTVVRYCEEGRELGLEAHAGPLGTARIVIEVRPWGEDTLVLIDEHPLSGVGGMLHNVAMEAVIQIRHRAMLKRLADVCESAPRTTGGAAAAAPERERTS
ncbi:SRPBCC family protein [Streptomyces poonensis]|uniref:Polyketide cyclase n=1 Tax=Streptomyces poonensis TaxID=68255 RepID=A0A918PD13_9ACTN|nr:SRPBCC family protein [Streptomyces poonensis]GGY99860.1 polyketide cyclase [Streptomyces poonensis]GLJ92185.1 polyketide cyclase [Streptomyces poonensis]